MTRSSKSVDAITAHPIYGSALATLPRDRPIPLTEILAEYAHHARQLATTLLVAQTFEQVLEGCRVLPRASFLDALALLSASEGQRILHLFVTYLNEATTPQALIATHDLPAQWKREAWNQLTPNTQHRLQQLQRRRGLG